MPMLSGHPERFAGELVRLASDVGTRREIGQHGEKIVREVDVANVVERLGALYRSLTN